MRNYRGKTKGGQMTLKDRLKIERAFCIPACMPTTIDRINYYMLRWMRNDNRKGQRAFRIMNMLRRGR